MRPCGLRRGVHQWCGAQRTTYCTVCTTSSMVKGPLMLCTGASATRCIVLHTTQADQHATTPAHRQHTSRATRSGQRVQSTERTRPLIKDGIPSSTSILLMQNLAGLECLNRYFKLLALPLKTLHCIHCTMYSVKCMWDVYADAQE